VRPKGDSRLREKAVPFWTPLYFYPERTLKGGHPHQFHKEINKKLPRTGTFFELSGRGIPPFITYFIASQNSNFDRAVKTKYVTSPVATKAFKRPCFKVAIIVYFK